ncbi:hypothetical protein ACE01N_20005 [Saccharicrinis sp. FJH2]
MKINRKRKFLIFLLIVLALFAYYQIDYKRHFIYSRDRTEYITIWQRIGNNCYIIPGRYFGVTTPHKNYIKTVNHRNYFGIIWNTFDSLDFKISIYNDYQLIGWNENAKLIKKMTLYYWNIVH